MSPLTASTPEADISSAIVSVRKGPQENLVRDSEIRTGAGADGGGGMELLALRGDAGGTEGGNERDKGEALARSQLVPISHMHRKAMRSCLSDSLFRCISIEAWPSGQRWILGRGLTQHTHQSSIAMNSGLKLQQPEAWGRPRKTIIYLPCVSGGTPLFSTHWCFQK
jgi:hypothetical protein